MRWKARFQHTRIAVEDYQRPPNDDEVKVVAQSFRQKWMMLLGAHWVAYIVLFFLGGGLGFSPLIVGFLSLFAHQATFIVSSGASLDRVVAKRLTKVSDTRWVRVTYAYDATLELDSQHQDVELALEVSSQLRELSREALEGAPDERSAALSPPSASRVTLDQTRCAIHLVRELDGGLVLEARDLQTGERIDIALHDLLDLEEDALAELPRIDRQPLELEGDARAFVMQLSETLEALDIHAPRLTLSENCETPPG